MMNENNLHQEASHNAVYFVPSSLDQIRDIDDSNAEKYSGSNPPKVVC